MFVSGGKWFQSERREFSGNADSSGVGCVPDWIGFSFGCALWRHVMNVGVHVLHCLVMLV